VSVGSLRLVVWLLAVPTLIASMFIASSDPEALAAHLLIVNDVERNSKQLSTSCGASLGAPRQQPGLLLLGNLALASSVSVIEGT
jgi:hypothetical protein